MSYYNNNSYSVLQKLKHHTGDVTSLDFGPNSFLCTGSGDKTVVVWEWKPGTGFVPISYSPLLGHKYAVTCVRFAPHSRSLLASASVDGYTILWNIRTGKQVHSFSQSGGNGVRIINFNYDATLLATAGEGGTLCLWDLTNYSLIRTIDGHDEESIQGVSFSPDGMLLVSGDVTGTYRVWDIASTKTDRDPCLATVRDAHDLGINALEFSPQYTQHATEEGLTERTYLVVSCGNDHAVTLWQLSLIHQPKTYELMYASPPAMLSQLRGHNSAVSSVRVSPKGDYIASTSIDKTTRIWEISSGKCIRTLEGHSRYVACCAFSRSQILFATGSNDKMVTVWDMSGELDIDSQLVRATSSIFINGRSGSGDGMLSRGEKPSSVTLYRSLDIHSSGVNSCDFNSSFLATASSDRKVCIWSWGEGGMELVHTLDAHRYAVNQIEFSPSGLHLASCSVDGTTVVWDPQLGEVSSSGFHISGSGVRCVRYSPNATLLAVGGDDEMVHVYSTHNYSLIMSLEGVGEAVSCLSFSPDSSVICTGSADGHARLYSLTSPDSNPLLFVMENCHDLGVESCDFSPIPHTLPAQCGNDKYEVATCGVDCFVRVWKIDAKERNHTQIWKLVGHGGTVTCVRYSPNLAELIASTASDKTCRLWDSYSGDCLHVLNLHKGIVTCCSFSPDSTLLATGSIDKTVLVWELPKDLAFQSFVASRLKPVPNPVEDWSIEDVNRWFEAIGISPSTIDGSQLLIFSIDDLIEMLELSEDDEIDRFRRKVEAIRKADIQPDIPHELLCPITHQLMREPVLLRDGYTYERSAIESWLTSGHMTSPMSNEILLDTSLEPNLELQTKINEFIESLTNIVGSS